MYVVNNIERKGTVAKMKAYRKKQNGKMDLLICSCFYY